MYYINHCSRSDNDLNSDLKFTRDPKEVIKEVISASIQVYEDVYVSMPDKQTEFFNKNYADFYYCINETEKYCHFCVQKKIGKYLLNFINKISNNVNIITSTYNEIKSYPSCNIELISIRNEDYDCDYSYEAINEIKIGIVTEETDIVLDSVIEEIKSKLNNNQILDENETLITALFPDLDFNFVLKMLDPNETDNIYKRVVIPKYWFNAMTFCREFKVEELCNRDFNKYVGDLGWTNIFKNHQYSSKEIIKILENQYIVRVERVNDILLFQEIDLELFKSLIDHEWLNGENELKNLFVNPKVHKEVLTWILDNEWYLDIIEKQVDTSETLASFYAACMPFDLEILKKVMKRIPEYNTQEDKEDDYFRFINDKHDCFEINRNLKEDFLEKYYKYLNIHQEFYEGKISDKLMKKIKFLQKMR